jgi:hypothetical protein
MLYKRLLDTLLFPRCSGSSNPSDERVTNRRGLSFPDVWAHHSLDPDACFSPSFLQESAVLVISNGLGTAAENAVCLHDLEDVWGTTINELARTIGPGQQGSMVSNMLKLVYRRRGTSKKRPAYTNESSQGPSRSSSHEKPYDKQRYNKKGRAESEDMELQRAIHESLRHGVQSDGLTMQDETSEIVRGQSKDESQGLIQEGDLIHVPGGRTSFEDDLQRAIEESKKSLFEQTRRGSRCIILGFALSTNTNLRSAVPSTCTGFEA